MSGRNRSTSFKKTLDARWCTFKPKGLVDGNLRTPKDFFDRVGDVPLVVKKVFASQPRGKKGWCQPMHLP